MRLSNHSDVPVYTISGSSTARALPDWIARKRKRSLKNDPEYASRIELLQDFEFEEASQCVRVSEDGEWVMSTGTYKPQIHTHYLPHLALSFSRHTISLNKSFTLLSHDCSKSLHLQSDRSLEFHNLQGCHYTVRVPRYGRDVKYDRVSAEALVPTAGVNENGLGEVFRLNLETGKFMKAYEVDVGGDDVGSSVRRTLQGSVDTGCVNVAAVAEHSHGLLAFGTSHGTVELFDPRSRNHAGILRSPTSADFLQGRQEVTAVEFDRTGLGIATGSSAGLVHLYDLRSPRPIIEKDQGYGFPIQDIIYLSSNSSNSQHTSAKILSADKRIIKIWSAEDASPWTSVEPNVDINSVAWCKDTGMIFTANEGRQQHAFFVPQLGPAPKWCNFLDNLVEEMAEDPNDPQAFKGQKMGEVYDNYKFLTNQQLESLNLSHLIGTTSLLRPYMHGYFVAQRLYEEARLIADPFVWEEQRDKRVKEKLDAERESRIRGSKKVTAKVNKRLARRLADRQEKEEQWRARKVLENGGDEAKEVAEDEGLADQEKPNLLTDPRFAQLFSNPDFTIDETSREFQLLNPSTKPEISNNKTGKERALTAVEQEIVDDVPGSSSDESDAFSDEEVYRTDEQVRIGGKSKQLKRSRQTDGRQVSKPLQMKVGSSTKVKKLGIKTFDSLQSTKKPARKSTLNMGGEKEITFAPATKRPVKPSYDQTDSRRTKDRRSASGNVMRKL